MSSSHLQLVVLAVLLAPACVRSPWLLALSGIAGAILFLSPEWSSTIYSLTTPALILTAAGYLLKVLASALESPDSSG